MSFASVILRRRPRGRTYDEDITSPARPPCSWEVGSSHRQHSRRDEASQGSDAEIQAQLPAGMKAGIPYDPAFIFKAPSRTAEDSFGDAPISPGHYLFLGSVRAVIIPVIAIPISLVGAVFPDRPSPSPSIC